VLKEQASARRNRQGQDGKQKGDEKGKPLKYGSSECTPHGIFSARVDLPNAPPGAPLAARSLS